MKERSAAELVCYWEEEPHSPSGGSNNGPPAPKPPSSSFGNQPQPRGKKKNELLAKIVTGS
ncbi:hypothetical protein Ancab_024338 [Ancistrocladus abbreviatus]